MSFSWQQIHFASSSTQGTTEMKIVSITLCLFLLLVASPAEALDEQSSKVRDKVAAYLARIAKLSAHDPPYAPNAASGFFRERMKDDNRLDTLLTDIPDLNPENRLLWHDCRAFEKGIRKAFVQNSNFAANWSRNPELSSAVMRRITDAKQKIKAFCTALGIAIAAPEVSVTQIATAAATGKQALDAVRAKPMALNGKHANGHISVGVKAQSTQSYQSFKNHNYGSAQPVGKVMKSLCTQLKDLPTSGHNPWLTADWQVRFASACDAASKALKSIE
ncbi:MAG: hypothetical protein DKT66_14040 [Candidatus Melainabacteria bacterium]|nr:MAG: hypothetical protein DKT66_14040 [Candidatus Melainabacteria bacterium]